jgi:molybdopterin-guanine dinucleotide biosynthesis protein A
LVKICDDIDGYVLAGGASSRMGVDKAGVRLAGETLLDRATKTMLGFTRSVTVVGRRNETLASEIEGVRHVDDLAIYTEKRAPIIGLYTALSDADAEWVAVLAVDLPFVTNDLLIRLHSFCLRDLDAVVPVQPDGKLQPLCAFYRRDMCLPASKTVIESDDLSLYQLLSQLRTRKVEFAEVADLTNSADFFLNLNVAEDLRSAETRV